MTLKIDHLRHIEDNIIHDSQSAKKAIDGLYNIVNYLHDEFDDDVCLKVKWDGAPSIFAGRDPNTKEFFVATKSIFNKNPVVYYSKSEIWRYVTNLHLAHKLTTAHKYLSKLNIKGILQGDLLYTKKDLDEMDFNGQSYITFHPNTLIYAVPKESKLASRILASELGVVWHTSYRGDSFETLHANLTDEISSHLKETKEVWSVDAKYRNKTKIDADQYIRLTRKIHEIEHLLISNPIYKYITSEAATHINRFLNAEALLKNPTKNPRDLSLRCEEYIRAYYAGIASCRKTQKGKQAQHNKCRTAIQIFSDEKNSIKFFSAYIKMRELKHELIAILKTVDDIKIFYNQNDTHHESDHEGYVYSNQANNHVSKLINRYEFTRLNFHDDIKRGWQ